MKKRILSIFLALIMVVSIIPMSKVEVNAANGIQAKIDKLRAVYYTGTYFTASGGPCYDSGGADCALSNIPSRGGLPAGSTVSNAIGNGWSCNGFARYTFYYVFGKAFGTSTVVSKPSLGDIIETRSSYGTHYSMYLGEDANNYYVYDSNGTSAIDCSVRYNGTLSKSKHTLVKAYHATNYDSVNGSTTPTPSVNLVSGLAGQYYLKGKSTGAWLSVSESKDASTQPINTWGTWWENFRVKLVASGNGYKMNFPLVSSLLVNPYSDTPASGTKVNLYQDVNDITQWWGFEKVGDAYVIRCLYNPSLVLTDNGVNQATLTSYTGASKQLWYLYPATTTVTYNANGGSGAPGSQTKNFNQALTLSSKIPTRSGYTFLGWSTSSTATSATYSAGGSFTTDGNTTLYAVWRANTYTVSYNANGGSGAPSSQTKTHGSTLYLSNTIPTRSGYTFLGWSTSSTATSATYSAGGSFTTNANTTLYAVWRQSTSTLYANTSNTATISSGGESKYYTFTPSTSGNYVIYSTSDGDPLVILYDSAGTQLASNDDTSDSNNFRLQYYMNAGSSYRFEIKYWSSSQTGSIPFKFGNVYTISYNANGGTGAPSSQSKDYGKDIYLNSTIPTRSGYTFLGWSTSSTATSATYSAGGNFTTNANTTLYAVWKANTYTVSYNANGGTGAPSNQTKTHDTTLTLTNTKPTRHGYTFLGWSTSSTATSATYSAGGNFTINANTTLYAVWKANTYTVSFNANGGTGTMSSQTHTYGVEKELSANKFTRAGYTFLGWSTGSSNNTVKYTDKQLVKNITSTNGNNVNLFAVWKKNEVTNANKWVKDSKGWRYYDANSNIVKNQWKADSIGWCYLGADGYMVTNKWVKDSKGWCYVGADGYCVTNKWVADSKGWCYLGADGRMVTNKWVKDSKGWCYVGADGYCLTNAWKADSKGWCYLDANGRMVINDWVKDGDKWYYLDQNGYMVTGTKTIGGKTYKFASNGVWIG